MTIALAIVVTILFATALAVATTGPSCAWLCNNPICEASCTPTCSQPECIVTCISTPVPACEEIIPTCHMDCSQVTSYSNTSCPNCSTQCTPISSSCVAAQCNIVCAPPSCGWTCSKPINCPAPTCELQCEQPVCAYSAASQSETIYLALVVGLVVLFGL